MSRKVVTLKQIKEVGFRQKWRCNSCRMLLKNTFEVDHVIPICKGGLNETCNLQCLCVECHATKTKHDLSESQCTYVVCGNCRIVYSPFFKHKCKIGLKEFFNPSAS